MVHIFSWIDTAGECKRGEQHTGSISHTQGDLVLGRSSVPTWPQTATPLRTARLELGASADTQLAGQWFTRPHAYPLI